MSPFSKAPGRSVAAALLGVMFLAAGNLQAQYYPLAVNFKLTARFQASFVSNSVVETHRTSVARIATKDILKLLAAATTNDLTGARLVLANRTSTNFETLKGTNAVIDVSRFFSMTDSTNWVSDGTIHNRTGLYNLKNYSIRTITFNDGAGNSFQFSGLETDAFSAAAGGQGRQKFGETVTVDGNGVGQYNGKVAVFSGTITLSGKATY
jgi:hypothetical protein